jgi:hypothetical protein
MKKLFTAATAAAGIILIISCNSSQSSLQGKWQYAGGITNGKAEGATQGYQLQRTYTDKSFEAYMLEEGVEPERYQAGDYTLQGDSCVETETFNMQPSQLTGVAVHYKYQLKGDTLILQGTLPTNKVQVEEHWVKMK